MNRQWLIFVMCLFSLPVFSQQKHVYLNDDLEYISAKKFNDYRKSNNHYILTYELDSVVMHVQVQRVKRGKITLEQLAVIRTELSGFSGQSVPEKNIIVVNYHHGKDPCNDSPEDSSYYALIKDYLKKIQKKKDVSQFFVYNERDGIKDYGKKITWLEDKNKTLRDLFFPLQYPCGSFVLIDAEGNYYVQKGEYSNHYILDILRDKSNITNESSHIKKGETNRTPRRVEVRAIRQ
ncbi:hypothetical protein ACILDS_05055 [Capnocytophaga canis]|uniref:Uncharacterized protein n=1 Tax=Capnocytophaga canis TaxID=1848903 RepID=A0A0B7I7U5_9FLAO|nr:hypothetical protein [Capnocytophaga canis]CEN45998.1 conserved exported hypothetical protein [Capnocytophaga canis]